MKKLLATLALTTALSGAALAESWIVNQTSDGFLNLREGPGTQYPVIRRIYPGDKAGFIAEKGSWLRVFVAGGHIGWASEKYMTPITSYSGEEVQVQPTSDGFLNLREGPGSDHAIKRRIYPGDFAVVVERSGNWTRILTRDGTLGYAHSRWLR